MNVRSTVILFVFKKFNLDNLQSGQIHVRSTVILFVFKKFNLDIYKVDKMGLPQVYFRSEDRGDDVLSINKVLVGKKGRHHNYVHIECT